MKTTLMLIAVVAVLAGCERRAPEPPARSVSASAPLVPEPPAAPASTVPAPSALHGWLGRWTGVEGTYLQLVALPDAKIQVIVKNLDGERSFEGVSGEQQIVFERDGVQEKIVATDGKATGMKWLADKTRCLTIKPGEGYCRE